MEEQEQLNPVKQVPISLAEANAIADALVFRVQGFGKGSSEQNVSNCLFLINKFKKEFAEEAEAAEQAKEKAKEEPKPKSSRKRKK